MFLRAALALILMVVPVWAQAAAPKSQAGQKLESVRRQPAPWLVTIVYQLRVKDLINQLQAQGYRVSPLNERASGSITNITSGLVISSSGRILARLADFRIKPKAHSLTVLTGDGRRLKPTSCEFDPSSGYIVLEVPDLAIEPPPFASHLVSGQQAENLRLLYQVPDRWAARGRWAPDHRRPARKENAAKARAPRLKREAPLSWSGFRVLEDAIRIGPKKPGERQSTEAAELVVKKLPAPDGSVVLNARGQVIGLTELIGPAKSVVKPIGALRDMAERLMARTRRGWLGVRVAQLPSGQAGRQIDAHASGGTRLVVREVFPGSPAAHAKLKPNDYIRSVSGQVMTTLRELSERIARTPIGTAVPLEILREGQLKQVTVRIAPRPRVIPRQPARARARNARLRAEGAEERKADAVRDEKQGPIGSLARLGLVVEPLDESERRYTHIFGSRGVLVTEVVTTSRAGRAGIRAGDVIRTVNGVSVADQHQLLTLIRKAARVGKVKLVIERRRHPLLVTVDLPKPF